MSLSKSGSAHLTGKVVVGMHTPGPDEMSIQEIEGKRQLLWDDATNEEYLNRVREKAKEAAKEIKLLAELEAEALRATARHEGYQEGLQQAQADVETHLQDISSHAEQLLSQLGSQGNTIYETRRQDILALIKLAVAKTLRIEMDERRSEILEKLMTQALERIESQRELDIRCNPAEAAELEEFIQTIQDRNPGLKYWKVKADPAIQSGGVIVEAPGGKVDNTIDTRWASVEQLFNQLAEQITTDDEE